MGKDSHQTLPCRGELLVLGRGQLGYASYIFMELMMGSLVEMSVLATCTLGC